MGDATCILAIRSEKHTGTAEQVRCQYSSGAPSNVPPTRAITTRLEVSAALRNWGIPRLSTRYADVQEGSEVLRHFPAQLSVYITDIQIKIWRKCKAK